MERGIGHAPATSAALGPGDRLRLAETDLVIEVERDLTGRPRDGVLRRGQRVNGPGHDLACDVVVSDVLIVDHWGIVKADIGIKGCRIAAIGRAGDPDVDPDAQVVIGPGTEIIAGDGLIATAGGVDSHCHFFSPQQLHEALASGVTTLLGGGTGPSAHPLSAASTPGPENLHRMLQAADGFALNLGFRGQGNASRPEALSQQIAAGAIGLTLHGDVGGATDAIDNCLDIAEVTDTQVLVDGTGHDRGGLAEDTLAATHGRTVCAFASAGADGALAPDFLCALGEAHVLAGSRIRPEALAAEALLHDLGAISVISSGSGDGRRVDQLIPTAWQTAHRMKRLRGSLPADPTGHDNARVKRYVAKITINPARANGIAHEVGSVEIGKWADLVLWRPPLFGVRPALVIKGGFVTMAAMAGPDPGPSAATQLELLPMFGVFGGAVGRGSLSFVSKAALRGDIGDELRLHKRLAAVQGCRRIAKGDMVHNAALPVVEIDPLTGSIRADGLRLGDP